MLVPIKWLKDYVDINENVKTLGDMLTMSGSKVEAIEEMGKDISKVVVGKILKIEKHPDADKLVVTQVDIGTETIQIVTGADNIKEGDVVPIATVGSTLPGGVKIKKGKLRGIASHGMMCSAQELAMPLDNLTQEQLDGIYILEKNLELGKDIKEVLGLNDSIIEFEITNNRPDCLSVLGIARETAATTGVDLNYPTYEVKENDELTEEYITIQIENKDLVPRFAVRVIKNVVIEDSPAWMQDRLIKAGVRPINNIVDITNYVMLELGQPMHAYDIEKLSGRKINVRKANKNEKIVSLDEVERVLNEDTLVIADEEKAIGIAGIIGGFDSEISDSTKTFVLECANFQPVNVRLSSKRLGLRTEASSRFEKGVDAELVGFAIDRACFLVQELGAGEIVGEKIDIYPNKKQKRKLSLRPQRVRSFLGADISNKMITKYLNSLEFEVEYDDVFVVTIPTFRDDIEGEADLIEEVARLYGYENITSTLMDTTFTQGGKNTKQKLMDEAKELLIAQGMFEAYTYSFVSPSVYNKINLKAENPIRNAIKLLNPLGEEQSIMRTTLIPNMLEVISRNYNRKIVEGKFFELSRVYFPNKLPMEGLADEHEILTLGMYGDIDFFDLKGVIENLLQRLNIQNYRILSSNHDSLHPGRTAELIIDNKRIGWLGEVHPDVLDNYDIPVRTYIAELNFDGIVLQCKVDKKYTQLPKYPAVERDIAVVVADDITAGQIEEIIKNKGGKTVEEIKLFDIYRGSQVEEGYKSMAYKLIYRAADKTLTEEDISKVHNKILNSLANQIGACLRQ